MRKELLYGPAALIAVWYALCALKVVNPLFLPPPHQVLVALWKLLSSSAAWQDILSTTWRVLLGFVLAGVIGIPVGLFMGYYARVNAAFESVIEFVRSLPAVAVFPLFMFFLGIGDASKIATVVFSCSVVVAVNAMYGVMNTIKTRQTVARLLDASRSEVFLRVVLMDALPQVFVGLRTSLSFAVIVIVATEMFVGRLGIGQRILQAQLTYRVAEMYAAVFLAGLLGYGLNKGFVALERRVVHWSGR